MAGIKQAARLIALNGLVLALLIVLIEGGLRLYLDSADPSPRRPRRLPAERLHTEYDPLLGWINKPNVSIDDMYGPGIFLRTNGQRFRNQADFAPQVPEGKLRVVCSGDSFTLGYGVSNDDAWCNRLALIDPRIEAVNMGQGGYGLDQAYLWYERDGTRLKHDIHVFAFISGDIRRMRSNHRRGFNKPVLRLRDGKISTENVPVPRRSEGGVAGFVQDLAIVRALGRVLPPGLTPGAEPPGDVEELRGLVAAVLDRISELGRERGARVLVVHLPTLRDPPNPYRNPVLRHLRKHAERQQLAYLDLTEALRALPPVDARSMFILVPPEGHAVARGHLSQAGNAFVAERVLKSLRVGGMIPRAEENSHVQDR